MFKGSGYMCMKTRDYFINDQESFLRHHQLFSMMIYEIYDLLILHQPQHLNTNQLFQKLTPFLKARISFVMKSEPQALTLFKNELDMVSYIANLLAEKIFKIYQLNHEYYYLCQS